MADIIFKVQRPLHEVQTDPVQLLVYDEHRTYEFFYNLSLTQVNRLFGNKPKIYVIGKLQGDRFQIGKTVEDQEW